MSGMPPLMLGINIIINYGAFSAFPMNSSRTQVERYNAVNFSFSVTSAKNTICLIDDISG